MNSFLTLSAVYVHLSVVLISRAADPTSGIVERELSSAADIHWLQRCTEAVSMLCASSHS
ncbi:hypothetical protein EXN66_Car001980 [Channa argus]|uniref:Secreted protein n=1 Tax=Channa argus TaxID=215402 RepID=A0A6G1P8D2_CHAAH|nr:hypothetical protein EXN66_Car001980 [Channa argus]